MIKQLKLTNHDEILCEIIDYGDDDNPDVIIRKAMKIVVVDDFETNSRFYTFKPWMSFVDDSEELQMLNSVHVVGECTPSATVIKHYEAALLEVEKYNKLKTYGMDINDIAEKISELSEEEMDAFLDQKYRENNIDTDNLFTDIDSSDSTIVQFKPKNTRH